MFQIEFNDIEDCAIIKISRRDLIEAIYDLAEKQKKQEKRMRHGRWVHHTDWESDGECAYECSVCGMGSDVDYAFCMRCGAKMDGGSDG